MKNLFVLACLLGVAFCSAKHPVVVEEGTSDDYITAQARQILTNLLEVKSDKNFLDGEAELGFSWNNCGKKTDAIQVESLTVSPDPIIIPGNLNVSAHVNIAKDFTPTSVSLKVYKKLFGVFIEIPCVDNIGSCTYQNPCALLAKVKCPPVFKKYGITCTCPIKKSDYNVPSTVVAVPTIKLPSFIENGAYKIQATLMNGAEQLGCYEIQASLHTK